MKEDIETPELYDKWLELLGANIQQLEDDSLSIEKQLESKTNKEQGRFRAEILQIKARHHTLEERLQHITLLIQKENCTPTSKHIIQSLPHQSNQNQRIEKLILILLSKGNKKHRNNP